MVDLRDLITAGNLLFSICKCNATPITNYTRLCSDRNHRPQTEGTTERVRLKANRDGLAPDIEIERIVCPIDPTHTIYKHNFEKHSKICNVRKQQKELLLQEFYCQDCNSGVMETFDGMCTVEDIDPATLINKIKLTFRKVIEDEPHLVLSASTDSGWQMEISQGQTPEGDETLFQKYLETKILNEVAKDKTVMTCILGFICITN